MWKSVRWDIYTILIVGLVPVLLLAAWGLTAWEDHRLHQIQCNVAVEWLEESADIAPEFAQAQTMDRTAFWLSNFEEINSPMRAGQLRGGILGSTNYAIEHFPDQPTDAPGVLNPKNGLFARDFEEGAEELVEHCPKTEELLPTAFPMVFPERISIEQD